MQIRRGVAVQGEDLVPTEHVITLPIRQQVGVFHRAETDDPGDLAALRLRQRGIFFRDHLERALLRFVEQVGELHVFAGARFERLAVVAQDRAEPDMRELHLVGQFRMPAAKRGEQLLKVQLLAAIGDIDDLLRLPGFEPVGNGRQIGRGVVETAVAFLDELRIGLPFAVALNEKRVFLGRQRTVAEDALRAFAFAGDALGHEFGHDVREARIVKTFAERMIKLHPQPAINSVELDLRKPDHLAPDGEVFRRRLAGVSPVRPGRPRAWPRYRSAWLASHCALIAR